MYALTLHYSFANRIDEAVIAFLAYSSDGCGLDVLVVFESLEKPSHPFNVVVRILGIGDAAVADHVVYNLQRNEFILLTNEGVLKWSKGTHDDTAWPNKAFCFCEVYEIRGLVCVDEHKVKRFLWMQLGE